MGAKDQFIANEFERHFLVVGIRAALMGAGAAIVVFVLLPLVLHFLGQGGLAAAEFKRLLGSAVLDPLGYFLLGLVVVVVAALCMLTSRYGVHAILKTYN